jgi:cell division septation protein DedD
VPATVAKRVQTEKLAKRSGVQVQLLSSRSADEARNAWARLKDKNGDLLGTLSPTVARADLGDRGTFYRLRAGPIADEAKARAICDSLAGRGASCIIVQPSR